MSEQLDAVVKVLAGQHAGTWADHVGHARAILEALHELDSETVEPASPGGLTAKQIIRLELTRLLKETSSRSVDELIADVPRLAAMIADESAAPTPSVTA